MRQFIEEDYIPNGEHTKRHSSSPSFIMNPGVFPSASILRDVDEEFRPSVLSKLGKNKKSKR